METILSKIKHVGLGGEKSDYEKRIRYLFPAINRLLKLIHKEIGIYPEYKFFMAFSDGELILKMRFFEQYYLGFSNKCNKLPLETVYFGPSYPYEIINTDKIIEHIRTHYNDYVMDDIMR